MQVRYAHVCANMSWVAEEITKPQEPTGLRDYGIKIGLFEPVEAPVIKLTPKGEAYEALDEDWPWLVDE